MLAEPTLRPAPPRCPEIIQPLTARQREVLGYLLQGHSFKEIAVLLGVTPRTVRKHLYRAEARLEVHNQYQLVAKCVIYGFVAV